MANWYAVDTHGVLAVFFAERLPTQLDSSSEGDELATEDELAIFELDEFFYDSKAGISEVVADPAAEQLLGVKSANASVRPLAIGHEKTLRRFASAGLFVFRSIPYAHGESYVRLYSPETPFSSSNLPDELKRLIVRCLRISGSFTILSCVEVGEEGEKQF